LETTEVGRRRGADLQVARHAAEDVGLIGIEPVRRLRAGEEIDHLEKGVARGERDVLGLVAEGPRRTPSIQVSSAITVPGDLTARPLSR